jgi:hypothetical protein
MIMMTIIILLMFPIIILPLAARLDMNGILMFLNMMWIDGWIDGWMGGSMGGLMGGWVDR